MNFKNLCGKARIAFKSAAAGTVATSCQLALATPKAVTAINNGKEFGNALIGLIIVIAGVAGVAAILYGANLIRKKGQERGGEDVEVGKAGWAIAGGVMALSISLIAAYGTDMLGGSSSDIGRSISITGN